MSYDEVVHTETNNVTKNKERLLKNIKILSVHFDSSLVNAMNLNTGCLLVLQNL